MTDSRPDAVRWTGLGRTVFGVDRAHCRGQIVVDTERGERSADWDEGTLGGIGGITGVDMPAFEGVGDHAATMARLSSNRGVECSVTLDDDGVTVEDPSSSRRGQTEDGAVLDETSFVSLAERTERLEIRSPHSFRVGDEITYTLGDGETVEGVVADISGDSVILNVTDHTVPGRRADQPAAFPIHDAVSIRATSGTLGDVVAVERAVDGGYMETVAVPTLTEGRWAFSLGSYRLTGVVGVATVEVEGREMMWRSVLLGSDYTVEVLPGGDYGFVVVRDLDLRRWAGYIPEIYVHLVSDGEGVVRRVPLSEATPLTTRVYGPVTRLLDTGG